MKCECEQSEKKSVVTDFLMEMVGSILKTVQSGIIDRVESAVNRVVRDAVGVVIFAFLGLIGVAFFLVGLAVWLGSFTGLGLGVGLMIVGGGIFLLALLIALIQKIR